MILILLYYIANYVQKVNDPVKLLALIQKQQYDVRAFTLRWDEERKLYENIFFKNDAEFVRSYDKYPVDKTGKFITSVYDKHGEIVYTENNGYSINGLLTKFPCPEGYEGSDCQLKPLCRDPEDDNKILPITNIQFNALELFNTEAIIPINNAAATTKRQKRAIVEPLYHDRVFIQCKTKGDYELKVCPVNQLLDITTMKCNLYDICEDHLNGFKHNYKISNDDKLLDETEYYLCDNNKSKRLKCKDGTVFSLFNKGCIQKTVCYNQGRKTIPIDEHTYIQCNNDTGVKRYCETRVITQSDGTLTCKSENCKPQILTKVTENLTFNYGKITCNHNDEEIIEECDQTMNKYSWKYKWGNEFDISIDWPKSILYDDGMCKPPPSPSSGNPSILTNPIVSTRWTKLMQREWNWNLLEEKFICPPSNTYRWDYKNNLLIKDTTKDKYTPKDSEYYTVDPSRPCQEKPFTFPFLKFHNYNTYNTLPYKIVSTPVYLGDLPNINLWPKRINDKYHLTKCFYDYENRKLIIRNMEHNQPPFGFKSTTMNNVDLELITNEITKPSTDMYFWSIASDEFKEFTFINDPPPTYTDITIDCPTTIDISIDQKFSILWDNYKRPTALNTKISCDGEKLFTHVNEIEPLIFYTFVVLEIKNQQLKIGNMMLNLDDGDNLILL